MKDDKQMMEDEAQWVTMQLLRGQGGLRGRNWHCGGLLYHLCVRCHVGVFQGIDGAHYTVLTVVGRRLGRERKHSKWTHTSHTHIEKDALELKHAFQETGLMLVEAPGLLRVNRVNERVSATEWPLDHPFYCLTNSLCRSHLTTQSDPWGRKEKEEWGARCLIAAEADGDCWETEQQTFDWNWLKVKE